jgi:predicted MFS family arabinose efflux permease
MSNANIVSTPEKCNAWSGVFAMTLCVMAIIASEFLPVSLLTPIASDLGISEGYTGQSIAISGLFAVTTSLFLTTIIGNHDRKHVMLFFTTMMIISGIMVTLAPNAAILMIARALLGICIGGFWGMSASIIMRLVHKDTLPKALSLLNAGNAFAMMVAAPLGSYLGGIIGWRGSFFCIIPVVIVTLIWQLICLPKMPPQRLEGVRPGIKNLLGLLILRKVQLGMGAMFLLFMGMFSLFTYLRPFFETETGVNSETLSLLLLALGVSGLIGTFAIGILLQRTLYGVLVYACKRFAI